MIVRCITRWLACLCVASLPAQTLAQAAATQATATAAPAAASSAARLPALRSGAEIFQGVCQTCHVLGIANAPKMGDQARWRPLLKEGQVTLTVDGWFGVRGMPPRGGDPNTQLEEFARAVAYIARANGAKWRDPDAKTMARIRAAIDQRVAAETKKSPNKPESR